MKKEEHMLTLDEAIATMTLRDILHWIMDHADDEDAMDRINKATFPFTSKYKKYSNWE